MSAEDLLEKLQELGARRIGNEDYDDNEVQLKTVHSVGGNEGGGENVVRVFEHDNDGEKIYFRLTGFYSSYHGTDWDEDFVRVVPAEKVITVYNNY